MKMYLFTTHSYGQNYFVMAKSPQAALDALKISDEYGADDFKNSTLENLPRGFVLEILEEGQVFRSEVS